MLFILTGDIQIGKTRWLVRAVESLEKRGVRCYGVVAPGVWKQEETSEGLVYEKQGIDALLLPSHERISFAQRKDLVSEEEKQLHAKQSESAALAWAIVDSALEKVNTHFNAIAGRVADVTQVTQCTVSSAVSGTNSPPGLLVVDELGRLELNHNKGFERAVSLLETGPTAGYSHALIVVRDYLLPQAQQRFRAAWPDISCVSPTAEALDRLLARYPRQ